MASAIARGSCTKQAELAARTAAAWALGRARLRIRAFGDPLVSVGKP